MEGGEFDSSALAVCEKVSTYFDTPEEPLRCLEQIKGTEIKKAELKDQVLTVTGPKGSLTLPVKPTIKCLSLEWHKGLTSGQAKF